MKIPLQILLTVCLLLATTSLVYADRHDDLPEGTTCEVEGVTVPCDDEGIYDAHDPNCAFLHYHGDLNGTPDPDEYGCGHGLVLSVAPGAQTNTNEDSSFWNTVTDWLDVAFQSVSGGFSPKTVYETVDIVEDSSESIAENAENAEEYFETYEDAPDRDRYTLETENPEENAPVPSLYRWFWGLFE